METARKALLLNTRIKTENRGQWSYFLSYRKCLFLVEDNETTTEIAELEVWSAERETETQKDSDRERLGSIECYFQISGSKTDIP